MYRGQAQQAGEDDGEKVDFEEEAREREAALDDAIDARAVREEPLGLDRHFRRYWWYPGRVAGTLTPNNCFTCWTGVAIWYWLT